MNSKVQFQAFYTVQQDTERRVGAAFGNVLTQHFSEHFKVNFGIIMMGLKSVNMVDFGGVQSRFTFLE